MSCSPTTQATPREGVIDLALGHPSPTLLPLELLNRAARHRLSEGDPSTLQYGFEQGDGRFRQALASFLGEQYAAPVSAEELFVSNGVSQALDLICTLYTRPGDCVFVEEPTYFLALRILADHGLRVVGLATDEHGLVIEALHEALAVERPAFVYTIPSYQNPGGITLSDERRKTLVELALEHGFLVVADEVYHLLSYRSTPPRPLGCRSLGGSVLSLGSFSKILAPGLRLGWVQADPRLLARLSQCGLLDSGGGLNPFTSALVGSALERGLVGQHLEALRREYGARARALSAALRVRLPPGSTFAEPAGGFFVWLTLPPGGDSRKLLSRGIAKGVSFVPGTRFSSREGLGDSLRLSFSYYDAELLIEGVRRLAPLV